MTMPKKYDLVCPDCEGSGLSYCTVCGECKGACETCSGAGWVEACDLSPEQHAKASAITVRILWNALVKLAAERYRRPDDLHFGEQKAIEWAKRFAEEAK